MVAERPPERAVTAAVLTAAGVAPPATALRVPDVRSALTALSDGTVDAALVYRSDARLAGDARLGLTRAQLDALLATEPDYTLEESFQWDRSELPWPTTDDEVDEVWRKNVKSDGLRLMLTGKTWTEAAETLKDRYERSYKRITQLTNDDVFEMYMNAVAHNIDPHSSYLSPRQSEEYRIQMSLSYDGIGASLQLEDDYVKVMNIIAGGPAQADGRLKEEDRITAVGEGTGELVDVIGWRLDDVVQKIRGPGGTRVRLQVRKKARNDA